MCSRTAVIIGSGVAGLATAIRLAVHGYQVSVYEKNDYPGGKLSTLEKDGYFFDAGPSLFTQPQNIEELFELAGEPTKDYITWRPLDISCKYFYESGKIVQAFTEPVKFAEEMKEQLQELPQAVAGYMGKAEKLYSTVGSIFLNNSLHKKSTWVKAGLRKALSALKPAYLFSSLHQYNRRQFTSAEAIQLFNRFATYNGSNPYKAPAMLSLISHIELNRGTFYPYGGMVSIANALYKLACVKGVKFYFNSPVQRILQHEGTARGIVVGDTNISADIVVSNSDVYFTYKHLLQQPLKAQNILRQERSSSAIIFYWGIRKEFKQLQLHNIFFSKDYKKEFEHIFGIGTLTEDPTVYVNITAKMEQDFSPPGTENWFVMVNTPANQGQDWEKLKQDLRRNVINKLSRVLGEDIEPLIETEQSSDPLLIEEQTASYMGSLYGTSSNSRLAAFFRPANFTTLVKGLYFCGGSVHPGGGIPLCLKSAKIVSDLIKEARK